MAFNLVRSLVVGAVAAANPWGATTLEWEAASPPPAGNFAVQPAGRSPYRR
jgi:cytochrome c oxidase subunit 1